jgi:hypothetical protein
LTTGGETDPCLSAAICAFVEAHYDDDETRNRLCAPVSLLDDQVGWLATTLGNMMNQGVWSGEPNLNEWIANNRLDAFSAVIRDADMTIAENKAIMEKLGANLMPAISNLQKLIEQASGER